MISISLWFLASILNGAMDMNFNMFGNSIFSTFKNQNFWNPQLSWVNKWKDGDRANGEKFFGSSTFLVWTTDSWHLIKMLFLTTLLFSILSLPYNLIFESIWLNLLLYIVVWFLGFESTLRLLKIK